MIIIKITLYREYGKPEKWVAKRIFNIGKGKDCVTLTENQKQLEAEVRSICLAKSMLHDFYEQASDAECQIAEGM